MNNVINIANLFMWTDFLGILVNVSFLLLGLWVGHKRGKKAGIRQKEQEARDLMMQMILDDLYDGRNRRD